MQLLHKLSIIAISIFVFTIGSPNNCIAQNDSSANIKFNSLLSNYWTGLEYMQPLNATINGDNKYNSQFQNISSKVYRDQLHNFYTRYNDSLKKFEIKNLNEEDAISFLVLKFDINMALEGEQYDMWKIPITQFGYGDSYLGGNILLTMGQFGSGTSAQPFKTIEDYNNWLKRITAYTQWCDSAINNFREGISSQYVLPRSLVIKIIDICDGLIAKDIAKSIFYGPVLHFPKSFTSSERKILSYKYKVAIKNQLNVAHKKLSYFLKNEYLAKARLSSGLKELPNGLNYYKYCVRYWTTSNDDLDSIYNKGKVEIQRIRKEMVDLKNKIGFKGDLSSFFKFLRTDKKFMPFKKPQQVLDSFQNIYSIIKPNLKNYFTLFPKSKFEIHQTEAFRAASGSVEYLQGTSDGSRPGIFYVPILNASTFNINSGMESSFLHEAIPGHHYQTSLQMENTALPAFRRFNWYASYGEGWAFYCESLGKELGLYTNPYQQMGALGSQNSKAIRMVIDIAIHSKGMSREEAITYLMENGSIDKQNAISKIELYMALPGHAISYAMGGNTISRMRNKYSMLLKGKFDIREFHKQVLNSGCLPLVVLEDKLDKWAQGVGEKVN